MQCRNRDALAPADHSVATQFGETPFIPRASIEQYRDEEQIDEAPSLFVLIVPRRFPL